MKILFLHLSDLHLKSINSVDNNHISKILDSLRSFGSFDEMILVLSGDIAFSGEEEQYFAAKRIISTIFREIKKKKIFFKNINVVCVPGNHDVKFGETTLSSEDLNRILSDFSYSKYLPEEILKQKHFFEFAKLNKCFLDDSLFCRRMIHFNEFTVEVNLINSAVFSLLKDEDKGMHYIDQSSINQLNTPTGADFVISVMHHSPDWYIDEQKNLIESVLLRKSSLIFTGHEHWPITKTTSYLDDGAAFIHAGGSLCNGDDWSKSEFEASLLETDSMKYDVRIFGWNSYEQQYEEKHHSTHHLPDKPSIEKELTVLEEYKRNLFSNSYRSFSDDSQDYYVFPRIESETYEENEREFTDINQFINEIRKNQRILITGPANSGKTMLLKNMFIKLIDMGFCVVMCDIDTIKRKESGKIVKANFENIYGDNKSDYSRFIQLPSSKKVLIIDDIDQINQKDFEEYITAQASQFGLMIFAANSIIDLDMIKRMEIALKTNNAIAKYKIVPFYTDKRRELVEKLVILKSKKDTSVIVEQTVSDICKTISLQKRFINLNPDFIIQFVDYYCKNMGELPGGDSSVFSKVFEGNITSSLVPFAEKELSVEKMYKLLSRLAYYIHFNKKYPISETEVFKIIIDYNDEFNDVVKGVSFVNKMCKAGIIINDNGGYVFANKNQLAYFCAREINYIYNDTGNENDLRYLINNCCFGINADILMFISYITDSTKILDLFLSLTEKLTENWGEFDFADNCPKFLRFSPGKDMNLSIETDKEKIEKKEIENERTNNNKLQVIDLYDYDEKETEKLTNQIIRAISLLTIISRCLPGFEHNMNSALRQKYVNEIYSLPNKIYAVWAKEVDAVYDQLVEYLKEQERSEYQDRQPKIDSNVEVKFRYVAVLLLLDIYNIAASYSTRDNTIRLLDNYPKKEDLPYSIQNLMMLEQEQLADRFVRDSISLYKECTQNLPKFLIRNIVAHAYVNLDGIDYKKRGQLDGVFFVPNQLGDLSNRKRLLLKRSKQTKND